MQFERPATRLRQVPIVPLIDILFIVLIFFIVSSEEKKKRQVLRVELPTVNEVPSESVVDDRSVLAVDGEGRIQLDNLSVPSLKLLDAYLEAFVRNNPGRKLELEADKDLTVEQLVAIWDALTRAGFEVKDVPARIRVPGESNE